METVQEGVGCTFLMQRYLVEKQTETALSILMKTYLRLSVHCGAVKCWGKLMKYLIKIYTYWIEGGLGGKKT